MTFSLVFYRKCLLAFVATILWGSSVAAAVEILKTGEFTYHSSDGHMTILLVPVVEGVTGVFIATSEVPLQLQQSSLKELMSGASRSVFLRLSSKGFEEVVVGSRVFRRRGSFTVKLGDRVRVSVDENNPAYCSIVIDGNPPSILGVLGSAEVLNISGAEAVDLLTPPNVKEKYRGILSDYAVQSDHSLTVGNRAVTVDYVGIPIQAQNICQLKDTIVIDKEAIQILKKDKKSWSLKSLRKLDIAKEIFSKIIPLRVTRDSLIGLDPEKNGILHIHKIDSKNPDVRLCYVKSAELLK